MIDYIKREDVREVLHNPLLMGLGFTEWELDQIPMADVEPVRHARWAYIGGGEWCCTNCGYVASTEGRWEPMMANFCSECGAKMDLVESDG